MYSDWSNPIHTHLSEDVGVAYDHHKSLGSGDRNVETLWVAKETKMMSYIETQKVLAWTNLRHWDEVNEKTISYLEKNN